MSSLPTPENTPDIDRAEKTNRRLLQTIAIAVVLVAVGVAVTLWLRFSDSAKQSTTQHAANAILQVNERADCRTAYNSDRQAVLEHAQVVERTNVSAFGGYLLGQPGSSTEQLQANKLALDKANAEVAKLPTLNDMVDHGYVMNGVRHPPCPVVK